MFRMDRMGENVNWGWCLVTDNLGQNINMKRVTTKGDSFMQGLVNMSRRQID